MAGGAGTTAVVITSVAFASLLLLLGHFIRARVWVLRRIFVPSSLIGGMLGLMFVLVFDYGPATKGTVVHTFLHEEMLAGWSSLPELLISVVFACLFLGSPIPGVRQIWRIAGPQLAYGQILAWGQYAFPILVTAVAFVEEESFNSNPLIAPTVALGFEGGHGTAAALARTFVDNGYPEGASLSLCAATVGLLSGLIYGTAVINWAVAKGHLIKELNDPGIQGFKGKLFSGVFAPADRPSSGKQTVSVESLDSLAFHVAFVVMAMLIGTIIKRLLVLTQDTNDFLAESNFFSGFPLFPFTMFGGIMIQLVVDYRAEPGYIDRETMERISGLALDYTVVTAITTMEIDGLGDEIPPFLILVLVCWTWHMVCFFFVARWVLPDFWVERAVAELGQSMGITATGLLLLRMSDPGNKTPALKAFSYKQLLHEPVVGGGLWTALVIPFIKHVGLWPAFGVCSSAIVAWVLLVAVTMRGGRSKHGKGSDSSAPTESTPLVGSEA